MHMPRGKHHSDSADHLNERSTSPEICRSPRGDLISLVRVCFTGTLQAVDPPPPPPHGGFYDKGSMFLPNTPSAQAASTEDYPI